MTEQDFQNLKNLVLSLQKEIEALKNGRLNAPDQITDFEMLPNDATVGKDYVAYRFGCDEKSVVRGSFGTNRIPRICRKPLKFIKRDVDRVWRELTRPAQEIAAEMIAKANSSSKPKRRKSMIRRNLAA